MSGLDWLLLWLLVAIAVLVCTIGDTVRRCEQKLDRLLREKEEKR